MTKNGWRDTPDAAWRSINGEEATRMDIDFTPAQLYAMARTRERESTWLRRGLLLVMFLLTLGFAYNALSVSQLWVRLSQGWMLAWSFLLMWRLRRGQPRTNVTETCASYLRREFESKRRGFLEIQKYLLLLIPGILASWYGGGLAMRVGAMGVASSSGLYVFASGPWPYILIGLLLVVVCIAFGFAASKASRELEELRRRTQE